MTTPYESRMNAVFHDGDVSKNCNSEGMKYWVI